MILNAQRLVDKVRRYLNDTSGQQQGNTWSDADLIDFLNEEQEGMVAKTIQSSEDHFGVYKDMSTTAGQTIYPLFDGFLYLRKLDNQPAGAEAGDVTEARMIEGVIGIGSKPSLSDSQYHYALYGDDLHLNPDPGAGTNNFRGWFIREPGPILLELAATNPAADKFTFSTTGDAPAEDDIMVGVYVDVVAGTGIGQRRKITAYAGATRECTVASAFSPALDSTSKIATITRLPRLFHTLLVYGAAIRAKVQQHEDAAALTALYNDRMEDFEEYVERPRTYSQRAATMVDYDD